MLCLIDGRVLTPVDQFFFQQAVALLDVLDTALDAARAVLPQARVLLARDADSPPPLGLKFDGLLPCALGDASPEPRWMELLEALRDQGSLTPLQTGDGPVTLLCPTAGIVCRELLERLLRQLAKNDDGIAISADELHHNLHPISGLLPGGDYVQDRDSISMNRSLFPVSKVVDRDACFESGSQVIPSGGFRGSHCLGNALHIVGGAVMAPSWETLLNGLDAPENWRYVSSSACGDVHLAYAQPWLRMLLSC